MGYYRPQRNYGCRIHDQYTYFGMRAVVLENQLVRISILADKGTEIYEYLYKPKDLDFMWLTENGVQNPTAYLSTSADPLASFVDYYPGGWQEVFPNGGASSVYEGARFGQHGEVAQLPWDVDIVEDTAERVSVRFTVRTKKVPFRLTKILTLTQWSSTLTIEEELHNLSPNPLRYMWGQHLAYGKPFLSEGCRVLLPSDLCVLTEPQNAKEEIVGRVKRGVVHRWPYATGIDGEIVDLSKLPPYGTSSDIVYLTGFADWAYYCVENESIGLGFKVEWDAKTMPYLWFWQEFGATRGYPWYGRHYNIGLEPFCGYPTHGLEEAIRNGTAGRIGPNETKWFRMKTTVYEINKN